LKELSKLNNSRYDIFFIFTPKFVIRDFNFTDKTNEV
jgi:hypothetical protein